MIRLLSLRLSGIKNVSEGEIRFADLAEVRGDGHGSDVTGIYGQNGSGKTSVIDALGILKDVWIGAPLNPSVKDLIEVSCESLRIDIEYYIQTREPSTHSELIAYYTIDVERGEARPQVRLEKLACKNLTTGSSLRTLFEMDYKTQSAPKPNTVWAKMLSTNKERIDFAVAAAMATSEGRSLLFSEDLGKLLMSKIESIDKDLGTKADSKTTAFRINNVYSLTAATLQTRSFAMNDLSVVGLEHHASTSLGILNVVAHEGQYVSREGITFRLLLTEPQSINESLYEAVCHTIDTINVALSSLIPGLSLQAETLREELLPSGEKGRLIELVALRGDKTIPLRCESEGIKKIVTILVALIDVFTSPSACVAIDELDSGVFEYLLGEILSVIDTRGCGQLIFTAHNLIPLEVLSDRSIVFTTTNAENRYIPFKGHKKTNNLRDQYLRAINLGGQAELVYEPTSKYEIDNAFYQAGELLRAQSLNSDDER